MHVARQGVTLQALYGLGQLQQAAVGRAVRVVADGAVLDHRCMLEYLGSAYILMAPGALFVLADQGSYLAVVRIVATHAGQAAFLHWMVRGHGHAGGDVLVATHAQRGVLVGLPHADIQLLDLGRMQSMAVTTFEFGLLVLGKSPVHASVVIVRVTGQAFLGCRQLDVTAAAFGEMYGLGGMADQAIAVIDVDLVTFIRGVAELAGLVFER